MALKGLEAVMEKQDVGWPFGERKGSELTPDERRKVAEQYLPVVKRIAARVARRIPYHYPLDDIISAGMVGLMNAVERFDPSVGAHFTAYAEYRIKGAILDDLRSMDPASRDVRKKINDIKKIEEGLRSVLGREPEPHEVARELGMDLGDLLRLKEVARRLYSVTLDGTSPGNNPHEYLADTKIPRPEEVHEYMELRERLASAISELPERHRLILGLYYQEGLNLKEIGYILGLTEGRISQLRSEAVKMLRAKMMEE